MRVLSVTGTMSFTIETYEDSVYGRLQETVSEYMDEDMVDKLIPHLKKALCEELEARRQSVVRVESLVNSLFPEPTCESFE